jgi:RNA polymerase-binding transcription factor DksA
MPDSVGHRERLESRFRVLEARLEEMNQILREPDDDDLAEQAAELDEDVVLERLALASRDEILLIRAALQSIDQGTFGKCAVCGKAIGVRRLQALPETTSCLKCASSAS